MDRNELPYRQGVVAYIRNKEGKYLIFQHPDWEKDKWRVPGGGLKDGEDYLQAIKRELKEEFKISNFQVLYVCKLINQFEWPDELIEKQREKGLPLYRGQQQKQVLVTIDENEKIEADKNEVSDYKWVTVEDFPKYFLHPGQAELAQKVIDDFKENGY